MMTRLDRDHSSEPGRPRSQPAPPRRSTGPVLALQRVLGNRGTARVLARKGGTNERTFEHSVRIGELGPLEVTASNVADWIGKRSDADDLDVTTVKGKHSDELERLSESRTRIDKIEVQSIVGENSWVIVTFKNAVIRGYAADPSEKTEHWKAVRFDAVDIRRTSIGKPRS